MDVTNEIKEILNQHNYDLIKMVGKGGFSVVFLVTSRKYNNTEFVVKAVFLNRSESTNDQLIKNEIDSLEKLNHPNIIKLYEYFQENNIIFLILEYCQNGSILSKIKKNGHFDKAQFMHYSQQILSALQFCHQHGIAHRDIKPENILIGPNDKIRIADFGMSRSFDLTVGDPNCSLEGGSLSYMSPEMLNNSDYNPFQADVFALGITFYYMIYGKLPYHYSNKKDLRAAIKLGIIPFPTGTPTRIAQIIMQMTTRKPNSRITLDRVIMELEGIPKRITAAKSSSKIPPLIIHVKSTPEQISPNATSGISTPTFDIQNRPAISNASSAITLKTFSSSGASSLSNGMLRRGQMGRIPKVRSEFLMAISRRPISTAHPTFTNET
ncbi:Aurora kinase [Tritrichomonas foetus]|uniref:Aurora kinase n=1 Tax=Tritrichomonas foetus TaxID=1144522 RepID=A0A1J4JGE7_9EUKA|nr:Aurora kinase [Tritrichomonas foetus]|eukprot:OHS97375.1 Aurora kinase [Tritrichomonas foetus]